MNWRKITKWLLVITAVVWIGYDFLPFLNATRGDTISEVILYYSLRSFTLPFAFGMLCGHFFFPRDSGRPKPLVIIGVVCVVVALDMCVHFWKPVELLVYLQTFPAVSFFLAFCMGVAFWPQQKSDKLGGA